MRAGLLAAAAAVAAATRASGPAPFVGGYAMLNGPTGIAKIQALAAHAPLLPITRLWIGFVSPTMVYVPGSNTLAYTGLNMSAAADGGFAALQSAVTTIVASGVDVLVSLGGWDGSCFPLLYERNSVAGFGTGTPNYFKVDEYCGGDPTQGSPANEFCYVCEPPAENETMNAFAIFPEPAWSATWQQAVAYVTAGSGAAQAPVWDPTLLPGRSWTDPNTSVTVIVPGSSLPQVRAPCGRASEGVGMPGTPVFPRCVCRR